jgi:hypothetical protein
MINTSPVDARALAQEILAPRLLKIKQSGTAKWSDDIAIVAFELGVKHSMDPTELAFDTAAMMWREDNGGDWLDKDGLGDGGHGHGLMQIDDRYHAAFLAKKNAQGVFLWKIAYENIKYALESIYLPDLAYFKGDRKLAYAAYNGGRGRVANAVAHGLDPDSVTTGKNYGKDVWKRREQLMNAA